MNYNNHKIDKQKLNKAKDFLSTNPTLKANLIKAKKNRNSNRNYFVKNIF